MAIENKVFIATNPGVHGLNNFNDETVVQADLGRFQVDSGRFIVFGRVVINNWDGDPQNASARLTTLNGKTELDRVDVRITGGGLSLSISLQGKLILRDNQDANNIVDIRCSTYNGQAQEASLFVLQVDDVLDV